MIKFLMRPRLSTFSVICLLVAVELASNERYFSGLIVLFVGAIGDEWWDWKQLRADKV